MPNDFMPLYQLQLLPSGENSGSERKGLKKMTQNMARAFQEMESLSIQATRVNNSRLHTRIQTPDAEVRGRSIANPSPI